MDLFAIRREQLPDIVPCDGDFGETDFEGILPHPVPILVAMGDSHAALYGQNCRTPGMIKATYGTGSSIMMNIGPEAVFDPRLSTSIAYQAEGETVYCLEGNINYTGAVITWLKDDLKMIASPAETEALIAKASQADRTCVVPAFTGLSAPHWQMDARAAIMNMSRTTGRNEIVKAAVDSIAQQVSDVLDVMREASRQKVRVLRVDGGPTRNGYLMKTQSLLADCRLEIPDREELSVIGAAYLAGRKAGLYDDSVFDQLHYRMVESEKDEVKRNRMRHDWRCAMDGVISCAASEKQQ
jgi:glycerol kinase